MSGALEEARSCRLFLSMIAVTANLGVELEIAIQLARSFTEEALQALADREREITVSIAASVDCCAQAPPGQRGTA
jgi:phosphate uptake regulator